eukprot:965380-Ditylum_brightwellii.AAC.1
MDATVKQSDPSMSSVFPLHNTFWSQEEEEEVNDLVYVSPTNKRCLDQSKDCTDLVMASEGNSHGNNSLVVDGAAGGDACQTSAEWNVGVGAVQSPLWMNKHTKNDTGNIA